MGRGLSDFVVGEKNGHLTVDSERISQLSDEDFRRLYDEEMGDYMKNHGKEVRCTECYGVISAPENLVRCLGTNLHDACFLGIYKTSRDGLKPSEKLYFDKIVMVRTPLSEDAPAKTSQ